MKVSENFINAIAAKAKELTEKVNILPLEKPYDDFVVTFDKDFKGNLFQRYTGKELGLKFENVYVYETKS